MADDTLRSGEAVRLVVSQMDRAVETLTRAFQADPAYTYLFPDAARRSRSLRALWQGVATYCLTYGEVYTTLEVRGVACWLPPGNTEVTLWRQLRTRMALPRAVMAFEAAERRRFLAALNHMEHIRRRIMPGPHWYLWALGVHPSHQGQGIGGRLIEPVLARSGAERTPCYLEALTEPNVAFYRERGFEVAHDSEVPRLELRVWAMVRKPQG